MATAVKRHLHPCHLPFPLDGSQLYCGRCHISNFQIPVQFLKPKQQVRELTASIQGKTEKRRCISRANDQGHIRPLGSRTMVFLVYPKRSGVATHSPHPCCVLWWGNGKILEDCIGHIMGLQKHMPSGAHSVGEAVQRIVQLQKSHIQTFS